MLLDNLDELPFPDYSLIDLGRYEQHLSYAYNHRRQGVLLTSRGCPFLCTYCNTFAGKTARLRSAENVVAEMEQMSRDHAIEDFYVVDDIFNMDRKRTEAVFRMIIGLGKNWRLYFVNGLRADIMTRELVDLMADAGTVWVTYAVESGSPRIQKLVKKNMHLDRATEIINYSQDRGHGRQREHDVRFSDGNRRRGAADARLPGPFAHAVASSLPFLSARI